MKDRQGLVHLKELTAISTLFTDEGLSYLQGMNELECLRLSGTKITDGGMPTIAEIGVLKELWLEETPTRIFNHLEGADDSSGIATGCGGNSRFRNVHFQGDRGLLTADYADER